MDLSSLVTGDGTYCIRIACTSGNGVDYSTREGRRICAQLVVTLASWVLRQLGDSIGVWIVGLRIAMADQGNGLGVKTRPRIIDWRCFGSLRAAAQPLTIDRKATSRVLRRRPA